MYLILWNITYLYIWNVLEVFFPPQNSYILRHNSVGICIWWNPQRIWNKKETLDWELFFNLSLKQMATEY